MAECKMKIKSSRYLKSFVRIRDFDLELMPSIAFIGRSNVGKSRLINSLLNRKNLVKTSSTPGKTQMINYFMINDQFYFVDLPGYGFARVPDQVRTNWLQMIEVFLRECPDLRLIVQLVDIRHSPTNDDILFQQLVRSSGKCCLVIANKVDKIKRTQIRKAREEIKGKLSLEELPILHSAPKKIGQEDIWASILETF
jgi:GTP-binding protein